MKFLKLPVAGTLKSSKSLPFPQIGLRKESILLEILLILMMESKM